MENQDDNLSCVVCYRPYDQNDIKPVCLVPCGHTLCLNCTLKLDRHSCPYCMSKFDKFVTNWELIKINSDNQKSKRNNFQLALVDLEKLRELSSRLTSKNEDLKEKVTRGMSLIRETKNFKTFFNWPMHEKNINF